jgi:hypothetical protein
MLFKEAHELVIAMVRDRRVDLKDLTAYGLGV